MTEIHDGDYFEVGEYAFEIFWLDGDEDEYALVDVTDEMDGIREWSESDVIGYLTANETLEDAQQKAEQYVQMYKSMKKNTKVDMMDAKAVRHARLEKMKKELDAVSATEEVKPTEPVEETSPDKKEGSCKECRKKMMKDELPTDSSASTGTPMGDTATATPDAGITENVGKCNCKQGYHRTESGKCCDSNGNCHGGWEKDGGSRHTHGQRRGRDRGRFSNPNPKSVRKFLASLADPKMQKSRNDISKAFAGMLEPSFLDCYSASDFASRDELYEAVEMNVYGIQAKVAKAQSNPMLAHKVQDINTDAVCRHLMKAIMTKSELPAEANDQEDENTESETKGNDVLPAEANDMQDDKETEEGDNNELPAEANEQQEQKYAGVRKSEEYHEINDDDVVEIEEEDGQKKVEIESKEEHDKEVEEGKESEEDNLNKSEDCGCSDDDDKDDKGAKKKMSKSELPAEANEQQDDIESEPKKQEVLPTDADEQQEEQDKKPSNKDVLPEEANDQQDDLQSKGKKKSVRKQSVTSGGSEKYDGRQNYNQSPMMRQAIDNHFKGKAEPDSAESELVKSFNERIASIQGQRHNPALRKSSVPNVKRY